jgi:alpha-L-fucosidase
MYRMITRLQSLFPTLLMTALLLAGPAQGRSTDETQVEDEHALIGVETVHAGKSSHTDHPDAQWYPDAGLGLFIHWSISSVKAMNISWPMVPGRPLGEKRITDPAEIERIVRESDYNLDGHPPEITPNEYWAMAADFNPQHYDPDKWLRAAKKAGFTYAVLTARHHDGFALWPSAYGDLNTQNYMGGRDLVRDFVAACRRNGLKVGLYYSPPDWYFDRAYMNFLYKRAIRLNPELPPLGPDLTPRPVRQSKEQTQQHQAAYAAMVKGQIEELLTRYGSIDLLWFDGRPPIPNGKNCITIERIRELQPGVVINPRLHGQGDFITYERVLKTDQVADGWAEFCNTWTAYWVHVDAPFRHNGYILGQFVKSRSLGINYLLGVGPMATGEFCDGIYENMAVVQTWMQHHGAAVKGTGPLPAGESASVPATASGTARYLFVVPQFQGSDGKYEKDLLPPEDVTLTLRGVSKPETVCFLADATPLAYDYADGRLTVEVPAGKQTSLVDVVAVRFGKPAAANSPQ